jgi:hypothetical protein
MVFPIYAVHLKDKTKVSETKRRENVHGKQKVRSKIYA